MTVDIMLSHAVQSECSFVTMIMMIVMIMMMMMMRTNRHANKGTNREADKIFFAACIWTGPCLYRTMSERERKSNLTISSLTSADLFHLQNHLHQLAECLHQKMDAIRKQYHHE